MATEPLSVMRPTRQEHQTRTPGAASMTAHIVRSPIALTALIYAGIVLLLWLPLGSKNGMPYETALVYNSETSSFWDGLFYVDPLRVYTSVFYNIGYHLSDWLGIGGSFLGYQIIYAVLWWARGVLAYLIADAIFPRRPVLSFLVGALVLLHASDHALNWVGQLNQFGVIFWTLLSLYLLVLALKAPGSWATVRLAFLATFSARMSLWSYESQLFIILLIPLFLGIRSGFTRRTSLVLGVYYLVPLLYIWLNLARYATGSLSYQRSVLRSDLSLGPLTSDLWFNLAASLEFWRWQVVEASLVHLKLAEPLAVGGGMAVGIGTAVIAFQASRADPVLLPSRRNLAIFFVVGVVLLLASFPAYLLLTSARTLWRTQFLSGIGAAVVLGSAVALLATLFRTLWWQIVCLSACVGVIAYFGVGASFVAAGRHYEIWRRHRTAMAEVLGVAPRLERETLVVLTNVPKNADPFGDNMWFDVALRLAYPHVPVTGIYYYADGTAPPGQNMDLRDGEWAWDATGFPTLLQRVPLGNTIVVRYSPFGRGSLVDRVPSFIEHSADLDHLYDPAERIDSGPPPSLVRRRYGPIPRQ